MYYVYVYVYIYINIMKIQVLIGLPVTSTAGPGGVSTSLVAHIATASCHQQMQPTVTSDQTQLSPVIKCSCHQQMQALAMWLQACLFKDGSYEVMEDGCEVITTAATAATSPSQHQPQFGPT